MKINSLITALLLLTSTSAYSAIYSGSEAASNLETVKANKKSLTGFKCNVTKKYVSKIERKKKNAFSNEIITTPHYATQTVNDITCNIADELAVERIRTSSAEIGTIELENDVDTQIIMMGKAGRNKNTKARNLHKAIMVCDDRSTTMMATFDRVSETIESAYYTSKQGTRGDTIKLFDARANNLPLKQWASVNILTNCRVTTK